MASKARNVSFLLMSNKVMVNGIEVELNKLAFMTYLQTYLKGSTITTMYGNIKVAGEVTINDIMDSKVIREGGFLTDKGVVTFNGLTLSDLKDPLSELDKFMKR